MSSDSFADRYGRWALIAGASEGVGASVADELAGRGLDLFLVSRNGPLLDELATAIGGRHGVVETRTLALDLTDPQVAERLAAAAAGLEVGLLVYVPGAVNVVTPFLERPFDFWEWQIEINCRAPVALVRAFAPAMAERGRGGIVVVGSTGCLAGTPYITVYSAAKMFQVNFVEGLWAELHPQGIDVCCTVIGGTHTPSRQRALGVDYDPANGDLLAEDVAAEILEHFADGPVHIVGEANRAMAGSWIEYRREGMERVNAAMQAFAERRDGGHVAMGLLEAHANLAGKTAVVVGGANGLVGRAVTLGLAGAGVDIATCDIDEEGVGAIVPEVEALGRKILSVHADVGDPEALDRFYDQVEAELDRVDILVNVVGGVQRRLFLETTREQNARDIRLNYGYVIDSVRRAVPLMRRSGEGGSIVNFTTIEAHRGAATYAVYAGAKAATTNYSRAMALELGADGIRVNLIAPDTNPAKTSNAALYPEDFERLAELGNDYSVFARAFEMYVPLKEAPTVDDVVNAVLFLASDLSRSITGTVLHVDGGTSAAWGFIDWPYGDSFMPAPLGGTLKRLFGEPSA